MKRQDGYYWILLKGVGQVWQIAEWKDNYWHLIDRAVKYYDMNFEQIDEKIIVKEIKPTEGDV